MDLQGRAAPRRCQLGPLGVIDFPAKDAPLTVVLFHGYGADAADLAPLALEIPAGKKPLRWVFPDAPGLLEDLGMPGRAWFPVDMERLQRSQMTGQPWDHSKSRPDGLDETKASALDFLAALGAPWDRLVLGGFSQGAMLATELALSGPAAPRGLMILSGTLIDEPRWAKLAPARKGLPFFQSHGSADPILGYPAALKLEALLRGAGLKGSLLRFEGGHGIPPEVLDGMGAFLRGL